MQNVLDILLLLAPVLLALVVAVVGTAAAEPTDGVVDVHHQHAAYFFWVAHAPWSLRFFSPFSDSLPLLSTLAPAAAASLSPLSIVVCVK